MVYLPIPSFPSRPFTGVQDLELKGAMFFPALFRAGGSGSQPEPTLGSWVVPFCPFYVESPY